MWQFTIFFKYQKHVQHPHSKFMTLKWILAHWPGRIRVAATAASSSCSGSLDSSDSSSSSASSRFAISARLPDAAGPRKSSSLWPDDGLALRSASTKLSQPRSKPRNRESANLRDGLEVMPACVASKGPRIWARRPRSFAGYGLIGPKTQKTQVIKKIDNAQCPWKSDQCKMVFFILSLIIQAHEDFPLLILRSFHYLTFLA